MVGFPCTKQDSLPAFTKETPPAIKRMALGILPDRDRNVLVSDLEPLLQGGDETFKEWLVHVIGTLRDQHRLPLLQRLALQAMRSR